MPGNLHEGLLALTSFHKQARALGYGYLLLDTLLCSKGIIS